MIRKIISQDDKRQRTLKTRHKTDWRHEETDESMCTSRCESENIEDWCNEMTQERYNTTKEK